MAATYTLPPLSDVMARALGSGAGGPPDAAAQIRSVLTGPPQDMTSPEAKPWIDAMNPKPEFDHRAVDVPGPPDAGGSLTADDKDTVPLLRCSLDQLNISAARLRSAQGMIGFHEADLAKAKNTFAASQTRLRNGVRGPEAEDALWNYNYNKADVASRQGELDWANHELREAQARHDDHQAWHDSMFKKPAPTPDPQTGAQPSAASASSAPSAATTPSDAVASRSDFVPQTETQDTGITDDSADSDDSPTLPQTTCSADSAIKQSVGASSSESNASPSSAVCSATIAPAPTGASAPAEYSVSNAPVTSSPVTTALSGRITDVSPQAKPDIQTQTKDAAKAGRQADEAESVLDEDSDLFIQQAVQAGIEGRSFLEVVNGWPKNAFAHKGFAWADLVNKAQAAYEAAARRYGRLNHIAERTLAMLEGATEMTKDGVPVSVEPTADERLKILLSLAGYTQEQRRDIYDLIQNKAEKKGYDSKGAFRMGETFRRSIQDIYEGGLNFVVRKIADAAGGDYNEQLSRAMVVADELSSVARRAVDPIEEGGVLNNIANTTGRAAGYVFGGGSRWLAPVNAAGWAGKTAADLKQDNSGMDQGAADAIGLINGLGQALLPGVTGPLLKRVPLISQALQKAGALGGDGALRVGLKFAGQWAENGFNAGVVQPLTLAASQQLVSAFNQTVPGVDWGRQFGEMWHTIPESIVPVTLLALIGTHAELKGEQLAGADRLAGNPLALKMMGFSEEQSLKIASARSPVAALAGEWPQRAADPAMMKQAAQQYRNLLVQEQGGGGPITRIDGVPGRIDSNGEVHHINAESEHPVTTLDPAKPERAGSLEGASKESSPSASGPPFSRHPDPDGKHYSVAFRMTLDAGDFGRRRKVHFNRANKALHEALQSDPGLAAALDKLIPGVLEAVSDRGGRETPEGWLWQHDKAPGEMQLVPEDQHTPGSVFWDTLHPGGTGGYSDWAIPNGAPPN